MINKIIKYCRIVLLVILKTIKYSLLKALLSDKGFISYLSKRQLEKYSKLKPIVKQPRQKIISQIIMINRLFGFNTNCLIRSLVIRDVLKSFGHKESILLGVKITNNCLYAHAWISNQKQKDFNIVYTII